MRSNKTLNLRPTSVVGRGKEIELFIDYVVPIVTLNSTDIRVRYAADEEKTLTFLV